MRLLAKLESSLLAHVILIGLVVIVTTLNGKLAFDSAQADADTTPPTVDVCAAGQCSPHNFSTSAPITLSANATDDVGVTIVEFYIDGTLRGSDGTPPYQFYWDVDNGMYPDDIYEIKAIARDAAGNSAQNVDSVGLTNVGTFNCSASTLCYAGSGGTVNNFYVLGGNWSGNGQYFSNSSLGSAAGLNTLIIAKTGINGPGNIYVQAEPTTIGGVTDNAAVVWGYQNSTNYLYFSVSEANTGTQGGVFKVQNGSISKLADIGLTQPANKGALLRVELAGNTHRLYRNATLLATIDGTGYASGGLGLGTYSGYATFSMFHASAASTFAVAAPPAPTPTPTPTPTPAPTPTPTPTPPPATPTPTPTPTPIPGSGGGTTPTPTPTPVASGDTVTLTPPITDPAKVRAVTYSVGGRTITTRPGDSPAATIDTSSLSEGTHEVTITVLNKDGTTTTTTQKIVVGPKKVAPKPWYKTPYAMAGLAMAAPIALSVALLTVHYHVLPRVVVTGRRFFGLMAKRFG